MYKQATNFLFEALKNELLSVDITIEDVKYLNGYFIVDLGKDSVVHFHIKETPGWLYGIWWSPAETDKQLQYEIFTQYEEEIDKFKPSASTIHSTGNINLESKTYTGIYEFSQNIKFIHNEPYLAFYRDMHFTNFNTEYVSRAKAKRYYEKHFSDKAKQAEIKAENDKLIIDFYKEAFKESFDLGEAIIVDNGPNGYLGYDLVVKIAPETDMEVGNYYIETDIVGGKAIYKKYKKLEEKCCKKMKSCNGYWSSPLLPWIEVVSEEQFNLLKLKEKQE